MKTPGKRATNWIENFCVVPTGFDKGQHVRLTTEQKEILRKLFDTDESPAEITAPLSRYLTLLVVAGPRSLAERVSGIELNADVFSTWAATGPDLKSVLHTVLSFVVNCKRGFRRRHKPLPISRPGRASLVVWKAASFETIAQFSAMAQKRLALTDFCAAIYKETQSHDRR